MSLFSFFRATPPAAGGSARFQAFHRNYLADPADMEQVRNGLEPGVIESLSPDERTEAERLLLARLEAGGDSRTAIGLGLLKSRAAVEPLRRALQRQAGRGAFASPAYAEALWRIQRDPQAVDAVLAIARDPAVHESLRVDAVVALTGMPSRPTLQALHTLLQADAAFLVRYHSFKGLLRLHGYGAKEADDLTGAIAPHISGAAARPAARQAVQTRLAELIAGRTLAEDSAT